MEHVLTGGNVAAGVVRIGSTVRKPVTRATAAVEALLGHLAAARFEAAPQTLGRDEQGRHVLEYIPGMVAHALPPMTETEVHRLGALIRRFHDAVKAFRPPQDAVWEVVLAPDRQELICHNDLAPWNLVRDGDRWVFIDWDGAGPGSRLWYLAYAGHGFVPLQPDGEPTRDALRLRALADGYGIDEDQRRELPALIGARTRGMYDLLRRSSRTGAQPWARLFAEGHGDHWGPAADYIDRNHDVWTEALLIT